MGSRPKPGETEEDILRQQQEFLKLKAEKKITPSANVEVTKKKTEKTEEQTVEEDVQMQLSNTFEAIPSNISIGGIVEKVAPIEDLPKMSFSRESGFPRAKRRDLNVSCGKSSIFAQQMKKLRKEESREKMEADDSQVPAKINLPSESYILNGRDKVQIHKQNIEVLKTMSEKEILEEREKLLTTMDPAIVAFLKSRRKELEATTSAAPIAELNEAGNDVKVEEIEASAELLNQPEADKWINFHSVETNKLAWMKNIEIPKDDIKDKYEARFDFAGWLLPFTTSEIDEKNRILYHHGEEPGRPGYTLQELFQLARSSVIQQKIIALNTIANILSLHTAGVYENTIDIPIEQTFFVLRMCLDDNTPSVLNAAIKALRNMFYCEIDEACLSNILGFGVGLVQPILAIDEDEDDSTVNDQQLVEVNLVKCLARTDILARIRYIINTVRPATETVVYCLEILQRLVRDSRYIMTKLYNYGELISSIVEHFVPKTISVGRTNSPYGLPLVHAVKLLRLLCVRSRFIATELLSKHQIMHSIASYLSQESFSVNPTGLKLQTECLHLFSILSRYKLAFDYFHSLQPVLLRLVDYHVQKTNMSNDTSYVMQGHVASILILLSEVAKMNYELVRPFVPLIEGLAAQKWCVQCCGLTNFFCGKLQIISALLQCLASLVAGKTVTDTAMKLLSSSGFSVITTDLKYGSNILNNVNTYKSSANFKTVESVAWETSEHTVPILQTRSCIPFLVALTTYLVATDDLQLKLCFLRHENIMKYLDFLRNSEKYYLTTNWFTRIESTLIMNVLKMSVAAQKHLDTGVFYELAVKCLHVFNVEQKEDIEFIFNHIIFSTEFYPSDVLIKTLNISNSESSTVELSLSKLDEIRDVYSHVLGLKKRSMYLVDACAIDMKIGNIVPVDWIYSPILIMYSEQQENKSKLSEADQIHLIRNCLRWIYIYEVYFPELAACINVTDRFCRLACLFLGSDNLFLETEIQNLLEKCLSLIMKNREHLNFDKPVQGLSNFQDFYAQLLEQYQGVSYGNVLFGNFVLVPLAQRHNVKWRKTLWSEYAGVVQILNVPPEQCVCPLEEFLEPPEEELSLLKCYRRALVTGLVRRHSVLYHVANHHVEQFVAKKKGSE